VISVTRVWVLGRSANLGRSRTDTYEVSLASTDVVGW